MLGLMQNQPLLISMLLAFAERHHGDGEIVSRRVEGDIHRYTYADLALRTRKRAKAVAALGVPEGGGTRVVPVPQMRGHHAGLAGPDVGHRRAEGDGHGVGFRRRRQVHRRVGQRQLGYLPHP